MAAKYSSFLLSSGCAALAMAATLALGSCSGSGSKWQVKGHIEGASDTTAVVLEGHNQGYWYTIDTIRPSKDGDFKYAHDAQEFPDIYRLRVGESSLYFPIDSIETVSVEASLPDLGRNHSLSGSAQAETLAQVDSLLNASQARLGLQGLLADADVKRQLGQLILKDPSGIVAYYIVSKSIDGRPLFNPAAKIDNRYIGAVANAFNERRPNDPRTNYLTGLFMANRQRKLPASVEAKTIGAFDIKLFDPDGKEQSLLDIAAGGKVVLLSFTSYAAEWSPAFNVELNRLYSKYKDRGFEIYQVSTDTNDYIWKQAARNLPWVTVINNLATGGENLRNYNVTVVPTTFVINRQGELVERVLSVEDLDRAVSAHL